MAVVRSTTLQFMHIWWIVVDKSVSQTQLKFRSSDPMQNHLWQTAPNLKVRVPRQQNQILHVTLFCFANPFSNSSPPKKSEAVSLPSFGQAAHFVLPR